MLSKLCQVIGIPHSDQQPTPTMRSIWTDCLAYWEPRRIVYNGLLAVVVLLQLAQQKWWGELGQPPALARLVVAVALANLCYTVAHGIDVAVQHSDFRKLWLEYRGLLFVAGSFLGCVLAFLFFPVFVLAHPA